MTAREINYYLEHNYFKNGCKFIVPNIFYFGSGHEEDLLIIKESGSHFSCETKISRTDYFKDFEKKDRHQVIEHGCYYRDYRTCKLNEDKTEHIWYEAGTPIPCTRPNRFYFAVPANLIKKQELPHYAGLFYVYEDGRVEKVKEAKLLHKNRVIDYERIANKFYWMWRSQKPLNTITK